MNRHRDVGARRDTRGGLASVPELARALRRARTRQGLRLEDVSARTGLPLEQLQVLEMGAVERIPDRVAILRTLRRYADHLGLPGDRFVLAMVDQWPTTIDRATSVVAVRPIAQGQAAAPPSLPDRIPAAPAHPRDTGVVPASPPTAATPATAPAVAGGALLADPGPQTARHDISRTMPAWSPGPPAGGDPLPTVTAVDTGVVPTYQPPATARPGPHRPRTPLGLRVLVGVAAVAVLVGMAGLLVDHYEPHWLQDLGITHGPQPSHAQGASGSSTTSQAPPQPSFAVASSTTDTATLAVRSVTFTVEVTAVNGSSWIQATGAGKTSPTFAGVLTAGGTHTFSAQHSLVMMVGSIAAHLSVSVRGRTVGTYTPTAAPFTITLQTVP